MDSNRQSIGAAMTAKHDSITAAMATPRERFISRMAAELDHAYTKHGRNPWSRHEFYGVLKEEVDELWDAIKTDKPMGEVLEEVAQIACVCLRYVETGDRYRGDHPELAAHPAPQPQPPARTGSSLVGVARADAVLAEPNMAWPAAPMSAPSSDVLDPSPSLAPTEDRASNELSGGMGGLIESARLAPPLPTAAQERADADLRKEAEAVADRLLPDDGRGDGPSAVYKLRLNLVDALVSFASRTRADTLAAEVERLRKALEDIAAMRTWAGVWKPDCECWKRLPQIFDKADAALASAPGGGKADDMAYRFGCLLDHATGGRLSKTNYPKEVMYNAVNEHVQRCCDEAVKEAREEWEAEKPTPVGPDGGAAAVAACQKAYNLLHDLKGCNPDRVGAVMGELRDVLLSQPTTTPAAGVPEAVLSELSRAIHLIDHEDQAATREARDLLIRLKALLSAPADGVVCKNLMPSGRRACDALPLEGCPCNDPASGEEVRRGE